MDGRYWEPYMYMHGCAYVYALNMCVCVCIWTENVEFCRYIKQGIHINQVLRYVYIITLLSFTVKMDH